MNRSGVGFQRSSSNYKTERIVSTGHGHIPTEKERMSVFDRLGTRHGMNSSSGSGSHSHPTGSDYSKGSKNYLPSSVVSVHKPSSEQSERSSMHRGERGTSQSMKYDQDRHSRFVKRTSRSRSISPKYKRSGAGGAGTTFSSGPRKAHADDEFSESIKKHHHHRNKFFTRDEYDNSKSKESHDFPEVRKHKEKTHGTSKLKKQRSKIKNKLKTTASTDSSSKLSSTSKSESSSTSISEASSSSESSSSESSAPSIKLKTGKGKKTDGVAGSTNKDKHTKEIQSAKNAIGSSSSSIISAKHEYRSSKGAERGNSPQRFRGGEREYARERDYAKEKRSTGPANPMRYPHSQGPESMEHERDRNSRQDNYGNFQRKRKHSGESYGSSGKRSRHLSPSPGQHNYKNNLGQSSQMRRLTPPEGKRRYTPESQGLKRITSPETFPNKMRRERSPLPERIRIINTSEKHSYYEADQRRDRYPEKVKDMRGSGRPYDSNFGNSSFEAPKEKRPRERLAPARSSSPGRGRQAPPPHQGFEGPSSNRRGPLLPFPPGESQRFGFHQNQSPQHQHLDFQSPMPPMGIPPNPNMQSHARKQGSGPMIVKTKDALIQKYGYEEVRQSRVGMWVDETLPKETRPPLLPTPTFAPYKHPPAIKTEPVQPPHSPARRDVAAIPNPVIKQEKANNQSLGASESEVQKNTDKKKKQDVIEDALSDFSDDAEEILNEDIEDKNAVKKEILIKSDDTEAAGVSSEVKHEQENTASVSDNRDIQSNTGTHTDDDILERLDFEEISDDELGEAEPKVGIVDVLGVDWSSLINTEKNVNAELSTDNIKAEESKEIKLRERYSPANRFKSTGLPRALLGDQLFDKIYTDVKHMEQNRGIQPEEQTTKEELEFPSLRCKRLAKNKVMKKLGLTSSITAFTGYRDRALRRFLVGLPPEEISGRAVELPPISAEEEETDLDIFHKSIRLFKESMVSV